MAVHGELLSQESLQLGYTTFRSHFGPDVLKSIDGPALLNTMHAHGNKESLVYWLEFKNEPEFPGTSFGSIAGGSAHKFGLFRRKGTNQWVVGSPTHEKNISETDAVAIARKHRDQLLLGVALLEAVPNEANDDAYISLQSALEKQAPDICGVAWAHKYWSLLFPAKLDDYHVERFQRYNLLRLLQIPPHRDGLYACAGRFVQLASQVGWPMNHLTTVLNRRNGAPIRYWRVGTRLGEGDGNFIWPAMREGAYAAIGWPDLGDLSSAAVAEYSKTAVLPLLEEHYPSDAKVLSREAGEIRNFIKRMQEGDVVLAVDGGRVLGISRVTGPYRFEETEPLAAPHRRPVKWSWTKEFKLTELEGLRTAFSPVGRHPDNIIEIERRLLESDNTPAPSAEATKPARDLRLDGIPGRVQAILDRKGQAIIYGPPGTGKTYWALQAARDFAAIGAFGRRFAELNGAERETIVGAAGKGGLVRWCTFHPAYGYEDFIEGFRPQLNAARQLIFEQQAGIFKALCKDAHDNREKQKYVLVIDEINRGDIPRIFGELLTLLESDKRGLEVTLPVSGDHFVVPKNVYVIGTMNTADRSIALLDVALRRRFGFVELMPDMSVLGTATAGDRIPLGPWLESLNDRLRAHLGRDARNLQVGHAYLLENGHPVTDFSRFVRVLAEDLVPLLEEYCYEDYAALARILGAGIIDEPAARVRVELFVQDKWEELVQALLEPAPDILTTASATAASDEPDEPAEPEEPEDLEEPKA
jgi:5-methylcytosine-specific restriction protein B